MGDVSDQLGRRRRAGRNQEGWASRTVAPQPAAPPQPRTALIGRERDLAILIDLLSRPSERLVTLTGVGDSGKTRLGAAVASGIAGRACWVSLASIVDPALVLRAVANALGVIESPDRPLIESLTIRLTSETRLLVLDNREHVIDACAELMEYLLESYAGLRMLATTRELLQLASEQQW